MTAPSLAHLESADLRARTGLVAVIGADGNG
jgi:hypothetical protein